MLRWFLHLQIAAFERTWNYDASYIHEMIDVDPRAVKQASQKPCFFPLKYTYIPSLLR